LHAVPAAPHCEFEVGEMQALEALQHPSQALPPHEQLPLLHVWLLAQGAQAVPPMPQAFEPCAANATHCPLLLQQPDAQLPGPHTGPVSLPASAGIGPSALASAASPVLAPSRVASLPVASPLASLALWSDVASSTAPSVPDVKSPRMAVQPVAAVSVTSETKTRTVCRTLMAIGQAYPRPERRHRCDSGPAEFSMLPPGSRCAAYHAPFPDGAHAARNP
jgi:hypothetical protein